MKEGEWAESLTVSKRDRDEAEGSTSDADIAVVEAMSAMVGSGDYSGARVLRGWRVEEERENFRVFGANPL